MIFMDISMPVMDGVKATLLIREDEDNPNYETPIIACTAHALKSAPPRHFALGMPMTSPFGEWGRGWRESVC